MIKYMCKKNRKLTNINQNNFFSTTREKYHSIIDIRESI